jgi:HEAT repeat protein
MIRLRTAFLALVGPVSLILALGSSGYAAQEVPGKASAPPDQKRMAEMVAVLKEKLAAGMPLYDVVSRLGGDYAYAVVQLLDDPKVDRGQLLSALADGRGNPAVVMPAMVKFLKKEKLSHHRQAAVKIIGKYGERSVPALLDILKVAKENDMGKDSGVRSAALWALANLDLYLPNRDLNRLVLALASAMKNKDFDVRRAAVTAMSRLQVRDDKARMLPHPGLAQLMAAAKDEDAKVRELAAKGLGDARGLPEQDKKIIPVLLKLALSDFMDESRWAPRWVAIHALVSMGDPGIKPILDAPWGDKNAHIRAALIQALGKYGHKSKLSMEFLLDNIGDQYAIAAFAQINFGEAAKAAVPSLTESLMNGNAYQQVWSLEGLFTVGPTGPLAAAGTLTKKDSKHREAVLTKLIKVKFASKEMVPVLIQCLEDKSVQVRALTAQVLGNIGPNARAALRALDIALDDSDPAVRASVQEALKQIKR